MIVSVLLFLGQPQFVDAVVSYKERYASHEKIVITISLDVDDEKWRSIVFWNVIDDRIQYEQVDATKIHVWAHPGDHRLFANIALVNLDTFEIKSITKTFTFTVGEGPRPPPGPPPTPTPVPPQPTPSPTTDLDAIIKRVSNDAIRVRIADGNWVDTTVYRVVASSVKSDRDAELSTHLPVEYIRPVGDMLRAAREKYNKDQIVEALRRLDQ
jgi:hypothetical protein